MKIYVVRHGQSEDGALGLHQRANSPLSPRGIKEAKLIAERLTKITIEVIYTSPLKRAKQTAEIISQKIGQPIIENDLLRELKRPTEIEGQAADDSKVLKIKAEINDHINEPQFRYSDEETYYELKERASQIISFFEKVPKESVLLITHGIVLKMMASLITFGKKLKPEEFLDFYKILVINQAGLTVFEYEKEKGWHLLTWNDQAHLG